MNLPGGPVLAALRNTGFLHIHCWLTSVPTEDNNVNDWLRSRCRMV